jgi:hypothetical protein
MRNLRDSATQHEGPECRHMRARTLLPIFSIIRMYRDGGNALARNSVRCGSYLWFIARLLDVRGLHDFVDRPLADTGRYLLDAQGHAYDGSAGSSIRRAQ